MASVEQIATQLQQTVHPFQGNPHDYDDLMAAIGNARFVLLGEASHGTHEFYQARALISQRLVAEKGFHAVAVEADWPDAYRVNCYVKGISHDADSNQALSGFKRFPTWMWRNRDVATFVDWLKDYNSDQKGDGHKVGFYGLDLYSLHASVEAVLAYLEKVDPEAARRARYRYACFEHFGEDAQAYGYATAFDYMDPCEDRVVNQLMELQRKRGEYAANGQLAADQFFFAEQNAKLVIDAERYYRTMYHGDVSSWNLRDRHMADTAEALDQYLSHDGQPAKLIIWEHNSHLGDARATQMSEQGEFNVGQLIRERYGSEAFNIGFSTYDGTVTAASDWGAPTERKAVRPAFEESYEYLFHEVGLPNFSLTMREQQNPAVDALREKRIERAIGVIYRPDTERLSHYFFANLPQQFDAVIHFDRTEAVEPLDHEPLWQRGEAPESYPSGL